MKMRSVKFLIAAGAVTLSTAAFAADLPIAAPPMYAPPPPAEFGGWYLRGDIGMTNQRIKSLTNTDPNAAAFT
jgi:opacity protein-like surface antigen